MPAKRWLTLLAAVPLCACSSIDGLYTPACIAYEGNEIELSDNRFTWRRFTDVQELDEHDEPIDPFPGYPKTGHYKLHDSQLDLVPDGGEPAVSFYLHKVGGSKYMLSSEENERFRDDGRLPDCALRRAE